MDKQGIAERRAARDALAADRLQRGDVKQIVVVGVGKDEAQQPSGPGGREIEDRLGRGRDREPAVVDPLELPPAAHDDVAVVLDTSWRVT